MSGLQAIRKSEEGEAEAHAVLDAAKAAIISLTAEETAELERIADNLKLNVIRFWKQEMK